MVANWMPVVYETLISLCALLTHSFCRCFHGNSLVSGEKRTYFEVDCAVPTGWACFSCAINEKTLKLAHSSISIFYAGFLILYIIFLDPLQKFTGALQKFTEPRTPAFLICTCCCCTDVK